MTSGCGWRAADAVCAGPGGARPRARSPGAALPRQLLRSLSSSPSGAALKVTFVGGLTVQHCFFASPYSGWLKSKPWEREINAREHRERGNHPQPPRPKPSRPSLWQQRGNKADHERSERGRGGPAVPVHRGSKESHRGAGDITRMVRSQKDDAKRGIDGEEREIQLERDHVEDRERCPVCKGEPAEGSRRRHDPKPLMLFRT